MEIIIYVIIAITLSTLSLLFFVYIIGKKMQEGNIAINIDFKNLKLNIKTTKKSVRVKK